MFTHSLKNVSKCINMIEIKHFCDNSRRSLIKHLQAKIKFSGPITVHEYMKEVLTNPISGYYTREHVLGEKGDFITSPEISQMFGELVGIWIYSEWHKMGAPKPFNLVELGPGTASLMNDILRTLRQLKVKQSDLEIHMVEKSLTLSNIQEKTLCGSEDQKIVNMPSEIRSSYKSSLTSEGIPIHWHYHFSDVPKNFSMIFAHEFFDALPVHKLKKTEKGWREILIDIKDSNEILENGEELRYIISRESTPASKLLLDPQEQKEEVEVCPEAGLLVKELAVLIKENGGAALIIDYGHNGTEGDTLRAFKKHKQVSPLITPGECDLTCDVDFSYLKKQLGKEILVYGPVQQNFFLKNMGIELRLNKLLQNCSKSEYSSLISSYKMLLDPDKMGERFKVMAILPLVMKDLLVKFPPPGFFKTFESE